MVFQRGNRAGEILTDSLDSYPRRGGAWLSNLERSYHDQRRGPMTASRLRRMVPCGIQSPGQLSASPVEAVERPAFGPPQPAFLDRAFDTCVPASVRSAVSVRSTNQVSQRRGGHFAWVSVQRPFTSDARK
jgi:hypothetical protein